MSEKTIKLLNDSGEPRYIASLDVTDQTAFGNVIGSVEIFGYTENDIKQTSLYIDYKTSSDSDWERIDAYNSSGSVYRAYDTYKTTGEFYKDKYINVSVMSGCIDTTFYEQKFIFVVDTLDDKSWEFELLHFKPYGLRYAHSEEVPSPYIAGALCLPQSDGSPCSVEDYLDDDKKATISCCFATAKKQPNDVSVRYGVAKFKSVMNNYETKFITEPWVWSDRIDPEEFVYTNLKELNPSIGDNILVPSDDDDVFDYICKKDIELDFSDSALSDLNILPSGGEYVDIKGYVVIIGSSMYCRDGIDDQYFVTGLNQSNRSYVHLGIPDGIHVLHCLYLVDKMPY